MIDPSVGQPNQASTYVSSTGNTTSNGNDSWMYVGSSDGSAVSRAFLNFQTDRFIGEQVTGATLGLYEYNAGSCSAQPTSIQTTNTYFYESGSNATIWSNQPSPDTNSDWVLTPSFNTGRAGCSPTEPAGMQNIDVTKTIAGWAGGYLNHFGLELSAPWGSGETNISDWKHFCSSVVDSTQTNCNVTGEQPTLTVTYTEKLGLQSSFPIASHKLNDRNTLYVNTGNGNAIVAADDLHIRGVGTDLTMSRYYNSLNTASGAFGPGWTMSLGPDVKLLRRGSGTPGSWFDYQAPSGTIYGTFVNDSGTNNYYKPDQGGLNASLSYDTASGDYKLTFDGSRLVYWFAGCSTCDAQLVKESDRHGNSISFGYTSGALTSIVDTTGRTLTVTPVTGTTMISAITDNISGRTWNYGYSNGRLATYTNPDGKITNYGYASGILDKITDPPGSDAANDHPTTTLTDPTGQVTAIAYSRDAAVGGSYTYSYTYAVSSGSSSPPLPPCANSDDYASQVTDPNNHTTTYCFRYAYLDANNSPQKANEDVIDPDSHKTSTKFYPDANPAQTTDANGQATSSSTVFTYDTTQVENLTKVTEPADSGNTPGTTQLSYTDSNNPNLPTMSQNSAGNCTTYSYSPSTGDLTDSYAGQTGTGCGTTTSGNDSHVDYNSNGTLKDSYTPDGGNTSAQETVYTYYDGSTDGGNTYLDGQPRWVDQPGGTRPGTGATCSASTTLCTGYTYDSSNRPYQITDGNNNTVAQHYDGEDRMIEIDLGGATTCNAGHTNCYTYVYDAEGNIIKVTDTSNRDRKFTYDRLNRQTSVTVPGTTRSITTSWDGTGNLLSYADGTDTVTYTYEAANGLHTIVDAAGTFTVVEDSDGNRSSILEPNGVTINTSYHKNNQVNVISTSNATGLPGSYTYNYVKNGASSGQEEDQLQKLSIGGTATYYGYNSTDQLCWAGTGTFSACGTATNRTYYYRYDINGDVVQTATSSGSTYYGYNLAGELCYSGSATGTDVQTTCPTTPATDTTYHNDNAGQLTGTSTNQTLINYNNDNQATTLAPLSGTGTSDTVDYLDQGNDLRAAVGTDTSDTGPLGITAVTTTSGTTNYTRDPYGNLIDERSSSGTYYYLLDRQNTVTALINSSRADAGDYHYTPYGALTNASSLTTAASANPFRYTGAYQDTEGDNYIHLGARYYDPTAYRFTQPDSQSGSIANPRTTNHYTYTSGDPMNASDPTGRDDSYDVGLGAVEAGSASAIEAGGEIVGASAGVAETVGFAAGALTFGVGAGLIGVGVGLAVLAANLF